MCVQPDRHRADAGDEWQQRSLIEQEQHGAQRCEHRKGADASRAVVLLALVDALECQAHEHAHRHRQSEPAGDIER
jgi:hypothetical protein